MVCGALLDNLIERGLDAHRPYLFVIDGSKALSEVISKALREVISRLDIAPGVGSGGRDLTMPLWTTMAGAQRSRYPTNN